MYARIQRTNKRFSFQRTAFPIGRQRFVLFHTNVENKQLFDKALGCVMGAAIGDSMGSFCEFTRSKLNESKLNEVLKMPGGGVWGYRVQSGQITDDTEMQISLAYGLINMIDNNIYENMSRTNMLNKQHNSNKIQSYKSVTYDGSFDVKYPAIQYSFWNNSSPFDQGNCTRFTLKSSPNVQRMKDDAVLFNSKASGLGNVANGSCMRCMPLILYGHKLSNDNLCHILKQDSSLTHGNEFVYYMNTIYGIAVKYLLNNSNEVNRNRNAIKICQEWLTEKVTELNEDKDHEHAVRFINLWFQEAVDAAENDIDFDGLDKLQCATNHIGFLKIAFQRSIFHLYKGSDFETALKKTIEEGGDTDTNGCIVGGIIGAYAGIENIPKYFVDKIMNCTPYDIPRDELFQAKWYINDNIVDALLLNGPNDDNLKIIRYNDTDMKTIGKRGWGTVAAMAIFACILTFVGCRE